jgi:hypothetical protein
MMTQRTVLLPHDYLICTCHNTEAGARLRVSELKEGMTVVLCMEILHDRRRGGPGGLAVVQRRPAFEAAIGAFLLSESS